ncbi:MAG: nuclease [Synechococcaceae cyanobacterium]
MRQQALSPSARRVEHLPRVLLGLALLVGLWLLAPVQVNAAELLQVRGATQLQVGDRNRSYQVDLACIRVEPSDRAAATTWLKRELPRGTKLNIRPLQAEAEALSARVIRLDKDQDLGEALIQAGLAQADPCG